jgi:hypothetical protein
MKRKTLRNLLLAICALVMLVLLITAGIRFQWHAHSECDKSRNLLFKSGTIRNFTVRPHPNTYQPRLVNKQRNYTPEEAARALSLIRTSQPVTLDHPSTIGYAEGVLTTEDGVVSFELMRDSKSPADLYITLYSNGTEGLVCGHWKAVGLVSEILGEGDRSIVNDTH